MSDHSIPSDDQPRRGRPGQRRTVKKEEIQPRGPFAPTQRLLILDCWGRSGLPGTEFAEIVGISTASLYSWRKRFNQHGPAGLMDKPPKKQASSKLPEPTKQHASGPQRRDRPG